MRRILRIVLFVTLSIAPLALPAQEAAPPDAGQPTVEPTPGPEVPADAPPEATIVAPADAMPSAPDGTNADGVAAAAAIAVDQNPPVDPPAGKAEPASAESGSALAGSAPPPPPPGVGVAVGSLATVEEVSGGRVSNWFFLAVLALAVVLIATRVRRTAGETVSIQEERAASPPAPVPPIVRRS